MRGLWASLNACQPPEEAAADYSEICAFWGHLGGRETLHRYGRQHFAELGRMSGRRRRERLEGANSPTPERR